MRKNQLFQLRPQAIQDLKNIYKYSAQEFGIERAERYILELNSSFMQISETPTLGRDYSHVRAGLLAFNVVSHIVFFRQSANGIVILRILHKSMDCNRHLT